VTSYKIHTKLLSFLLEFEEDALLKNKN